MTTFKQFFFNQPITEKFHTYIKDQNRLIELYVHPNWADLNTCIKKNPYVRAIFDTINDDLYIWDALDALHYNVMYSPYKPIPYPEECVTLELYLGDDGFVNMILVTSTFHNTWKHNPNLKKRLLKSKDIKPLITPKMLKSPDLVKYYDGLKWDR